MPQARPQHHRIVIVGSGGGGLCMGMQLKLAGIDDFLIVDKALGLGGTWWHNTYPGAECDVQSHLYSFSFEPKVDWSRPFAGQEDPPRHNTCRFHRINNPGARMRKFDGTVRTVFQRQSGGAVAAP